MEQFDAADSTGVFFQRHAHGKNRRALSESGGRDGISFNIRVVAGNRGGKCDFAKPTGTRTARDSTSVNQDAEEPIDPAMPHMPPA